MVMGKSTISTTDTEIYYPSDWLIDGGPPFDVMSCPKAEDQTDDEQKLGIIYNTKTQYFGIVCQGYIVMESKEAKDLAKYIQDYAYEYQYWVENNKP
jgi:hypothetical protein